MIDLSCVQISWSVRKADFLCMFPSCGDVLYFISIERQLYPISSLGDSKECPQYLRNAAKQH